MIEILKTRLGLKVAGDAGAEPAPPKVTRSEIATLFRHELGYSNRSRACL